ncbi:MAG: hypothetical protein JSV49_06505 [Thermoplasmata archaeon]|nr:MAG: hypothetical protein JSV49_06505 [Thermoplasmata archaeon]
MGKVKPFQFYNESRITTFTGIKANSLSSMYKGIHKVSEESIFFHMHQCYFRPHFSPADNMNDFARWIWIHIGEYSITEKLAMVDPFLCDSVRECRKKLLTYLKDYLGGGAFIPRVSRDKEFYFLESKSFIYPAGFEAKNLNEFRKCIQLSAINSIFYHMISSRMRYGHKINDYSAWLSENLSENEKAERIAHINLFSSNLWDIRDRILVILDGK